MVAAKTKIKTCAAMIRKDGERVTCGKLFTERCPNSDVHIMALKTGFCANGWHEGDKAKDWRGNPAPTCKFILVCPCNCHDTLDKLYHMTDMERVVVDASGYVAPPRRFWMPSDDPLPALSSPSGSSVPQTIQEGVAGITPPRMDSTFAPTPTGRAARGELESWVQQECDAWLVDSENELCTPAYLATVISRAQAVAPPSVGAISAVFDRWVKLGFAKVEKRPTRFIGYTQEGLELGLVGMKIQRKRQQARQKADQNRRIR